MARIFVYDNRSFPDPDPAVSVEDVRQQLAQYFPELTNADTRQEQRGEDIVYTFSRRIGTKGAANRLGPDIAAILRRVPTKTLAVFDLAADLVNPVGELDLDATAARQPELNLARAEAEAYARATQRAVDSLRHIRLT